MGDWPAVSPGPPGPSGATGPPGPVGPSGGSYRHQQMVPASLWTIVHNLGFRPQITAFDSTGDEVKGVINHITDNQSTIGFVGAVGGEAYCS